MSSSSSSKPSVTLSSISSASTSRLQSLYSDFTRQKQSNPASYSSSISWWKRAFSELVTTGQQHRRERLVLHGNQDLIDAFALPRVGKPLALGAVVSELQTSRTLIPSSLFLSSTSSVYDAGWLPGRIASFVVGKPLWWAFEQLGITSDNAVAASRNDRSWFQDYIILELVEQAADRVIKLQRENATTEADNLYDLESFRETFSRAVVTDPLDGLMGEIDLKVLLKHLERDKQVISRQAEVIKFIDGTGSKNIQLITAVDHGILELKSSSRRLEAQIQLLQQKITDATQQASAALSQKHKPVALNFLRMRKSYEETLAKRVKSLQALQTMTLQIENACLDIEIVRGYETSTSVLQTLLAHPSLQRDHIDQTMDAMAEANAEAQEIHDAIHVEPDMATDDDELDKELGALEEEVLAEEAERKIAQLQVPSTVPLEVPLEQDTDTPEHRVAQATA